MAARDSRLEAAQKAINSIGLGFDLTKDIGFDNCKNGSRLIFVNEEQCRHLEIPGGVSIPDVPNTIKCVTGESIRVHSDVLTLRQMLEHFNQEMCLAGQTASGHFCASFGLPTQSIKDLASIKSLTYDGCFIKRYTIELERHSIELLDHVKEAVSQLSWDPENLAKFIERFGTHVIVGVSMGGKDVLYVRQEDTSYLDPASIQKLLKDTATMKFKDSAANHCITSEDLCNEKNVCVIHSRRGGNSQKMYHSEWLDTIDSEPDVISMFLVPLTSLLGGIRGCGFLTHAIYLYLRYKPSMEDLHQFLEFQLPRQWAPVPSEISLGSDRKHKVNTWIRLSILGPKLYINIFPVHVGNRPVVGLRLYLEGRSSNRLAIHLQHLASQPKFLSLSCSTDIAYLSCDSYSCKLHKKVKWNSFSHVCTAAVESDDSVSIVTGAQLQVENNCLFLRLCFSKVIGATLQKAPEWDQSTSVSHLPLNPRPGDVTISSAQYPNTPPLPVHTPKLLRFVDTGEIMRGPQDIPGHWVVSGARLLVQHGKICLLVKYSLFSFVMHGETGASQVL